MRLRGILVASMLFTACTRLEVRVIVIRESCPPDAKGKSDKLSGPPEDFDRDGFLDGVDKCPSEPGVDPDGCPLRDADGDGLLDKDDKCVTEPETRNGWEDTDGCPDELPKAVNKFTGVIKGIYFAAGKASIRPDARADIEATAKVLREYPDIHVMISGHTDSRERSPDLSRRRAEAVRLYLIDQGIAPDRINVRGAGADDPIGDNNTKQGRQKNRRIEFKLIID